ncbi:MAG TPA: DUF3108 domain-containing protein [Bacteroidota bacterium]|nr:DUF3108 domain-containing protein [Bacteroidota bacterium]
MVNSKSFLEFINTECSFATEMRTIFFKLLKKISFQLGAAVAIFFGMLGIVFSAEAKSSVQNPESMLQVGEELEYSVHYSLFNIGTIRLKILDRTVHNGKVAYRAAAYIDSNPSLSWLVNLHVHFFTLMDKDVFSYEWSGEDSSNKEISYQRMIFDYHSQKMYFEKGKKTKNGSLHPYERDTVLISQKSQDGLSLFYFARANVHQQADTTVPTCIENSERKTDFHFFNESKKVKIDEVDYPIDCVHFRGVADFTGIFGLSGGFEGWFSNDCAAVPITARLKVILGSVRVELRKWNRENWEPPRWSK